MTLIELANALLELHPRHHDDTVCVRTSARVLSGGNAVEITDVVIGFDWYSGKVMLQPSRPLELQRIKNATP